MLLAAAVSGWAGEVFGHAGLAAVLPVYAALLIPDALKSAPAALLKRRFQFADVAAADAIAVAMVARRFATWPLSAWFVKRVSEKSVPISDMAASPAGAAHGARYAPRVKIALALRAVDARPACLAEDDKRPAPGCFLLERVRLERRRLSRKAVP
ncbi:MAG: hypothetical protein MI723_18415 [Caulobacterales bacterium]|nr:hypothetical protein [Caulobacterales bacterium]